MTEGLRIYNLFPTLAGSIADWTAHAAAHRRDGVQRGLRQPVSLSRLLRQPLRRQGLLQAEPALSPLTLTRERGREGRGRRAARRATTTCCAALQRRREGHGLRVIMDLVVNHTAKDSELAARRPQWFARDARGEIQSPFAVDPDDPEKKTVWGDLAELDYRPPQQRRDRRLFRGAGAPLRRARVPRLPLRRGLQGAGRGMAPAGRCREIVRSRCRVLRRESRGAARRRCWRSPRPASTICSTA